MLTISNANPIQFWLTGEESFNQKEVCSIYPVCFCQIVDASDTLRFDLRDTLDSTNNLVVLLDDGTIWKNYVFSATGFDHHQYALIIGANGDFDTVIGRKLIFKIFTLSASVFSLAPSSWTDSISSWSSKDSTIFSKNISGPSSGTYVQSYQNCAIPSGNKIQITYSLHIDSFSGSAGASLIVYFSLRDSSGVDVGTSIFNTGNGIYSSNGDWVITQTITSLSDATRLYLNLDKTSSLLAFITITITPGLLFVPDSATLAFSDCVDITSNEDFTCTQLIAYGNSSDFAGLGFPSWSPPSIYYLRVPAVFFEEDNPQEQEDLELSDDTIITLWSKIEAKKTLEIGYMPFYMHLKLRLALMMDNVTIDGVPYRMRDPYQITSPSSKRSALRRATVVLSQKDFIDRNLL